MAIMGGFRTDDDREIPPRVGPAIKIPARARLDESDVPCARSARVVRARVERSPWPKAGWFGPPCAARIH
jgi:hypothetical protein